MHEIELIERGATFYRHETEVTFEINGRSYNFNIIETGIMDDDNPEVTIIPEDKLPFELTDELKDDLYILAINN